MNVRANIYNDWTVAVNLRVVSVQPNVSSSPSHKYDVTKTKIHLYRSANGLIVRGNICTRQIHNSRHIQNCAHSNQRDALDCDNANVHADEKDRFKTLYMLMCTSHENRAQLNSEWVFTQDEWHWITLCCVLFINLLWILTKHAIEHVECWKFFVEAVEFFFSDFERNWRTK